MKCSELARQIEQLQPQATARDVARLCLLLANDADALALLAEPEALKAAWRRVNLKLQAATDQHAAMTAELDAVTHCDPAEFSTRHIWTLIRAIKVQSQIIQLYVGDAPVDA